MRQQRLAGWLITIGWALGSAHCWAQEAAAAAAPKTTGEPAKASQPAEQAAQPAAAPASQVPRDPKGIKGISPFWESLRLGDNAYLARDYDLAIGQYRDAITKEPQNPIGHLRIAEAQLKKGELKDAEEAILAAKRFADKDPSMKARALFLAAMLQEQQRAFDAARAAWTEYQKFGEQQPKAKVYQRTVPERLKRIQTAKQLSEDYAAVKERIEKRLKEADEKAKKNAS